MPKKIFNTLRGKTEGVLFAATGNFVHLADVSDSPKLKALYSLEFGTLSGFVTSFFTFALAIGAIAAVLRIAYAGYLYMGSDVWTNKGRAKEVLTDVVIGLLLLLSIWLILHQINPDILNMKKLNQTPGQTQQIAPAPPATLTGPL